MFSANEICKLLELLDRPAFCVSDGNIICANRAALSRQIPAEGPVAAVLSSALAEYEAYEGGSLYLPLEMGGRSCGAAVTRIGPVDIFTLDTEDSDPALRAYALAAKALRTPLNDALTIADGLGPEAAGLNRSLYQMLRLVGNMSYAASPAPVMEMQDVTAVLQELFDHASVLCQQAGVTLRFENHPAVVYSIIDSDLLERCIYSILSNSLKYAGSGGTIDVWLTMKRNTLYLTIQDSGNGLDPQVPGNLFERFRRMPEVEDGRHGIGLGLMLARSVALAHKGILLMSEPPEGGTRFTLSLPIRQQGNLRSPIRRIDYAGERDRRLIELSESLPPELYANEI